MLKIPHATPLDINQSMSSLPTHEMIVTRWQGGQEKASGHSAIKHVSSVYCVLGSFLGPGLIAMYETGQIIAPLELIFRAWGEGRQETKEKTLSDSKARREIRSWSVRGLDSKKRKVSGRALEKVTFQQRLEDVKDLIRERRYQAMGIASTKALRHEQVMVASLSHRFCFC